MTETYFKILIGEKLSSVTFVLDYLQIDFDGNGFTFNIWPIIMLENIEYKLGDALYRDKLYELITNIVKEVTFAEKEKLEILFESNYKIFISLDPINPEIVTPEIGSFVDVDGKWLVF